jgi:hypothetical protein
MSSATVVVRYDGPVLDRHRMDVADLSPALMGLSDLCQIINSQYNRNLASVKVLIGADLEQQCFQFNFEVVQTVWQSAQGFLEHREVRSAKEILEWLGLLAVPGGAALGLFQLYKRLNGRAIESEERMSLEGRDVVSIRIAGDNNTVVVHQAALDLYQNPQADKSFKRVIEPVTRDGYTELAFFAQGEPQDRVFSDEARQILEVDRNLEEELPVGSPQVMTALITVYSPVYDPKAPRWRFLLNGSSEYMDISGTSIAADAVRRGGAMASDLYRVRLEIQQFQGAGNNITAKYKILEVLEFTPAKVSTQQTLIDAPPPADGSV